MPKINMQQHLRELIDPNGELDTNTYLNMNTFVVSYKKFCKILKIELYDEEGDKIYKILYQRNISLISAFAKSKKTKEEYLCELIDIYHKQQQYYISELAEKIEMDAINHNRSFSEASIEITEQRAKNSIGVDENGKTYPDRFLVELQNNWSEFTYNYQKFIECLLSKDFHRSDEDYEKILSDEKKYYYIVKNNKQSIYDADNSNTYKKLYMYARNRYLRNFYEIDFPDIKVFSPIKKYEYCIDQDIFSLRDLAKIYGYMVDDDAEKQYENIKKAFQKLKYTNKFKKDGVYSINKQELSEALAAYLFFKLKNHRESDYDDRELDEIIRQKYARILDLFIYESERKRTLVLEVFDFYKKKFDDILNSSNDYYQETMLEYMFQSAERVFIRSTCINIDIDSIYDIDLENVEYVEC